MRRVVKFLTVFLLIFVIAALFYGRRIIAFAEASIENPYIEEMDEKPYDESFEPLGFSDVPLDSSYSEIVYTLVDKGILSGYPDGTFGVENTLSRAEFATIMCRLMGVSEPEQINSIFPDVPYQHWASGYISTAQKSGYINGYTDGNFGPEDRLTYEQTITILVRGLGYEEIALQVGGYPSGYIQIAQNLGITDNTELKIGEPITRITTAILLINTLQIL